MMRNLKTTVSLKEVATGNRSGSRVFGGFRDLCDLTYIRQTLNN